MTRDPSVHEAIAKIAGKSLVIFDADDTLRRTTVPGQPCPHADGEWELMPGVREVLSRVPWNAAGGPRFAIASNQDHVGYGLLSAAACERLLRDLAREATDGGVQEPLIAFCPHRVEDGCGCRKPAPGLLLALLSRAGVNAESALFVGNAESDAKAAYAAGVPFCLACELFATPPHPE